MFLSHWPQAWPCYLLLPIKLKQEAMNVSTAFSTIVFSSTMSPDKDCSFGLDLGVKRHKQSHSSCVMLVRDKISFGKTVRFGSTLLLQQNLNITWLYTYLERSKYFVFYHFVLAPSLLHISCNVLVYLLCKVKTLKIEFKVTYSIDSDSGFFGGSAVKNLPAMQEPQEMQVQSLG